MSSQMLRRFLIPAGLLVLATALMLVFSVTWNNPVRADDDEDGDYMVDHQVVVKLDPAASTRISRINASYGTKTLEKLQGSEGVYLLQLRWWADEQQMAERMRRDWRVLDAEPNFIAEAPEGDARYRALVDSALGSISDQYAVEALNLSCAHSINRGQGSVVAVLDTGVQLDHPDLKDNLEGIQGYDFVDDDADPSDGPTGLDEDANGFADEMVGHGTHVSGIVALAAPEAKIMPVRALNSDGFGDTFTIAEAIYYAHLHGADVINLSLGTPQKSGLLQRAISEVSRRGTVVVASAGNSGDTVRRYPAADSSALAVTSVDEEEEKSTYASFGYWVDVAAPGDEIYSAFPISTHAWWSGTSMAAPFVSGQAALIHSVKPSLSVTSIQGLIADTAQSLEEQDPTYSDGMGDGLADVGASLGELSPGPECDGLTDDSAGGDHDEHD